MLLFVTWGAQQLSPGPHGLHLCLGVVVLVHLLALHLDILTDGTCGELSAALPLIVHA